MVLALIIIYVVILLWAISSIIMFGNRPARSIAWLFVSLFIPVFGILLYILFGINRKRFKFFSLNNITKRRFYDFQNKKNTVNGFIHEFKDEKLKKIGILMQNSSGFPALDGNAIDLLKNGKSTFDALLQAINNARAFIHLQYYIIDKGEIFNELTAILEEKLKNGVEVRIIYDAFGSYGIKSQTITRLKDMGAKIYPILPINIKNILSTLNYRNHRKLAIIDGKVAFTGGVNITDKYINEEKSELGIWHDLHLKIKGPIVDHLHRIFIKDFYFASNTLLLKNKTYLPEQERMGTNLLQVISGGPDLDFSSILHQYVMMIHSAENSIKIQNPYFIPNKKLTEALIMSALRGVSVQIMVPEHIDSKIAKYSMYSNFETLLKSGVTICVVKDKFFHSKLIIVDEKIASVGSGNFDYRSFEHNYELNLMLYNEDKSKELANDFDTLCKEARSLHYETFKNRPIKEKFLQGTARIFSPLL